MAVELYDSDGSLITDGYIIDPEKKLPTKNARVVKIEIVVKKRKDGTFVARVPKIPLVCATGDSVFDAERACFGALKVALEKFGTDDKVPWKRPSASDKTFSEFVSVVLWIGGKEKTDD